MMHNVPGGMFHDTGIVIFASSTTSFQPMSLQEEPLSYFCRKNPPDCGFIERFETGGKYAGVMLRNGQIGVCAIQGQKVDDRLFRHGGEPDLSDPGHRILVNAWLNAFYNYDIGETGSGDIFNSLRFTRYKNIVMIGSFSSLIEKFRSEGTRLSIFDNLSGEDFILPMHLQPYYLAAADCVILTGTTINNNTFTEITGKTPGECDIFLLGPSNILHRDMFDYRNIRVVFGSRFKKYDHEVLDIIRDGHGTRSFLKEYNKVYISA